MSWPLEDLIASITLPDKRQDTFEYDGSGVRVKITDSTGLTRYVWDGLDIVSELDNKNALVRVYAHGYTPIEGAYSLVVQHDASRNADYFYHEDQVGGIHALTDASGAVANTYSFLPFGEITSQTGGAPNRLFWFGASAPRTPWGRRAPARWVGGVDASDQRRNKGKVALRA